jgi:hypothetical protein
MPPDQLSCGDAQEMGGKRTLPALLLEVSEDPLSLSADSPIADPRRDAHASYRPAALPGVGDRAPLAPVQNLAVYELSAYADETEAEDDDQDPLHGYTTSMRKLYAWSKA